MSKVYSKRNSSQTCAPSLPLIPAIVTSFVIIFSSTLCPEPPCAPATAIQFMEEGIPFHGLPNHLVPDCILVHLALPIVLWQEGRCWLNFRGALLLLQVLQIRQLVCPPLAIHSTWGLVNNKTIYFSHWECTHHLPTNMRTAISALRSVLLGQPLQGDGFQPVWVILRGLHRHDWEEAKLRHQWACRHCSLFLSLRRDLYLPYKICIFDTWKACICYPIFCNEKTKQDLPHKCLGIWLI